MAKHRTHRVEFKRQVSQEYLSGETLPGLSKRHNMRNLIRIWVDKYHAGALDEDSRSARYLRSAYAALERPVGKLEFLKGAPRP